MASVALGGSSRTRAKRISAADAAALVGSGDWVEYGTGLAQPDVFDAALARARRRARGREDPRVPDGAPARRARGRPGPRALPLVQLALHRLRPREGRRRAGQLHPVQPRRDPGLLPALHRPAGDRRPQDLPEGRARLLQLQPRRALAPRDRRARQDRDRRGVRRAAVRGRPRERGARERGRLRDRGRRRPAPGDPEPASHRRRPRRRAADRRRGRGRQLPADRHRSDAERGLLAAARERRARPRRPHRDAHRRHRRPLPRRRRHRRPQDALPRQGRLHLRGRDGDAVRDGRPQPRLPLPRRRPDQPAAHRDAERPRGRDQQHDADGPAGPGRERVRRPPPHQRHRRAGAVRPRRLRLRGRQVVHLHVVDLRAPRRAREPHRAST